MSEQYNLEPIPVSTDHIEPWNCMGCGKFIHNTVLIDGKTYPTSGAPPANFGGEQYPRICSMCLDMLEIIHGSAHLIQIQKDWVSTVDRLKKNSG